MRTTRLLTSLVPLALAVGCSTVDPALQTDKIRAMPPAALRIAVLQPQDSDLVRTDEGLRFTATSGVLHKRLVDKLKDLRTASEVVLATDADAVRGNADVFVVPSVGGSTAFAEHELSSNWWAAGALWIGTWIGGLLTNDTTYHSQLKVTCNITNASTENKETHCPANVGPISTNFLERNSLFSLNGLQTLILPPFWTSDDEETTSAALTERATTAIASRLAHFLKLHFEGQAADSGTGALELDGFENGSEVGEDSVALHGAIRSKWRIEQLDLVVNDAAAIPVKISSREDAEEGGMRSRFATTVKKLRPGWNWIRLSGTTSRGDPFLRTLKVHNGPLKSR